MLKVKERLRFMYDNMFHSGNTMCPKTEVKAGQLTVEGQGTIHAKPDIATITVGVVSEGTDLNTVQRENNLKSAAVISAMKALGIEERDIRTVSYTVNPIYDYVDGKQIFRGYRISNMLEITIRDIERAGDIISKAMDSGANTVSNIDFTLSNPTAYYLKALRVAVKDAYKKAETIANSVGTSLRPIPVKITERYNEYSMPVPRLSMEAMEVPVQPGILDITAKIEAVFEYAV